MAEQHVFTVARDELIDAILAQYKAEGCGICKKPGADVFWFSPYSRCAHQSCYDIIDPAENEAMNILEKKLKKQGKLAHGGYNHAHIDLISSIETCIESDYPPGTTLLDAIKQDGVEFWKEKFLSKAQEMLPSI